MEEWTKSVPSYLHQPVTTRNFAIAVILFTLLGFILVFAKEFYPVAQHYYIVVTGFAGMLFLNVFIPHLLAAIYLQKYAPGVITGLFINLSLTSIILLKIHNSNILTPNQIL